MGPFEYLFNHIQHSIQDSLLKTPSLGHDKESHEEAKLIEFFESTAEPVFQGEKWIVTAELLETRTGEARNRIVNSIRCHLQRVTQMSDKACEIAIGIWIPELVARVQSLRQNPRRLPSPAKIKTEGPVTKPVPYFSSDEEIANGLFASDPARRRRACFRFLGNASLAKRFSAQLELVIEHETNVAIVALARRALDRVRGP